MQRHTGGLHAHPPNLSCCRACEGRWLVPRPAVRAPSSLYEAMRRIDHPATTKREREPRGMLIAVPAKTATLRGGLGIQVELQLIYRKDGRLPPHPLRARW